MDQLTEKEDVYAFTPEGAELVLGANDFRLQDAFQNPGNLAGENNVRVEIDLSGVGTKEGAALNIYRKGYAADDREDKPLISISAKDYPECNINQLLTLENKHEEHTLSIGVETDAPQLDDEGLSLETILVYISDEDFGGSVQTGITGHSLTFQISVDGAVLSLVLSEDGMLTLPERIAGTGALELWVTGQMCIVLVSVGTPSDYPGVIS